MSRFSGPQPHEPLWAKGGNKGAQALAKSIRRQDAQERDEVTPPQRRSTKRRAKREKGTPPAVSEAAAVQSAPPPAPDFCPWPWKDRHPSKQDAAIVLRRLQHEDDSYRTAEVYPCPSAEGADRHWHIGHPPVTEQRRKGDRRREEAA